MECEVGYGKMLCFQCSYIYRVTDSIALNLDYFEYQLGYPENCEKIEHFSASGSSPACSSFSYG